MTQQYQPPRGQDPYQQQQYQPQQPYAQQYAPPRQQAPPPRKRRVWPWVLLVVVLVPVLGFAGCAALVGGAASSINDSRQGGSVGVGQTFTYKSGLALSAAVPTPYKSDNQFVVGKGEVAYESKVTITNGTDKPVNAILIQMNATLDSAPTERLLDEAMSSAQDIAPGQKLVVPFRFKTKAGATGPLQIAITDTFNEPVFFTARIGK